MLDAVLQIHDDCSQWFKIRESMVPFKAEEVALNLALCYDGDIVSFKHERIQSEFERKFLDKIHSRYYDAIN